MNTLKTFLSKLLGHDQRFPSSETSTKSLRFPTELSSREDIFQYLNFNIPDLQPVKLSLEFGQEEKAFGQFFHYIKRRQSPTFMCNWWKRDQIIQMFKEHFPEAVPNLLKVADNILQHQFLLFGRHTIYTGSPIFWSGNYEAGIEHDNEIWEPGKPYSRAELLKDPRGDIHFVWELNRHQHFLDLGKAYWYTREEEFAQEFITEINDWIAQNPYPLSVNWADTYEIALRGIFWLFGYTFFVSSDYVDDQFFCRFYQILLFHGHAIYEALQGTSRTLAPQQLTAHAAFIYLLGTVFPEYRHSKTWSAFGWEILQWKTERLSLEQLLRSSLADLVNTIEFYCMVLTVRRNNRFLIPQNVIEGLTAMLDRFALFIKPDGSLSRFGERYPVQLIKGMYTQSESFGYLFAMGAILLKKAEFKVSDMAFEEPLLWYFGPQGYQEFQQLSGKLALPKSYFAPQSPYAVMRSGWEPDSGYCLISTGLSPNRPNLALKHSDVFSIELFANGCDFVIDSGAYCFRPDNEWNQYFRSTYAHNSITVDRIQHIDCSNQILTSEFDQWLSTPDFDFVSGYQTGFEDLEGAIRHRRSIFYLKPHYWLVCDLLTGEGQHFFDQYFHFPPFRLNVDFMNKRVNFQIEQTRHFTVMPVHSGEMDMTIFTGGDTPDSGWISDGYRYKMEAPFIKYGKQAIAPTSFHTLLFTYNAEQLVDIAGRHPHVSSQERTLLSDEVSAIELTIGAERHYFVFLYKPFEEIHFDAITFSGTFFFMRQQQQTGELLELILHNATLLAHEETVLFKSDTPVEELVLQLSDDTLHVSCSGNSTFRMQLPHITQVFVNSRKAFLKYEHDMLLISTLRV